MSHLESRKEAGGRRFVRRVLLVRCSARLGTSIPKNDQARRVVTSRQLSDVLRGWKTLSEISRRDPETGPPGVC